MRAFIFAFVVSASCEEKTGDSMFPTSENAANVYRSDLSEVRKVESLQTEHLVDAVNNRQTLRDSVFSFITGDTLG